MSDGEIRRVPVRAPEESDPLTPAELQETLTQLRAGVKSDQISWAVAVGKQVGDHPDPPTLDRTGVPAYLNKAPEAIRIAAQKTYARSEAERDLRASMRAEVILRGTEHASKAEWLARHHARVWKIDCVSADLQEREAQLKAALDRRYGR